MSQDRDRTLPARTTIVGGQPSGNAREAHLIPVALEGLLGMAATTPPFAEALLNDPTAAATAAASAAGIELTATEGAILVATDRRHLAQMVDEVRRQLGEPDRRAFLEQAALAVAVLVGGGAILACAGCTEQKPPDTAEGPRQPAQPTPPPGMRATAPMDPQTRALDAGAPVMQREAPAMRGVVKGVRPNRPRPIEPGVITGSRPRSMKEPRRPRGKTLSDRARNPDRTPHTYGMRPPRGPTD